MGLLDDAIREHLDLKRRRGADPGEIERAEREALGPVRRGPEPPEHVEPDSGDKLAYDQDAEREWEQPLEDTGDQPAFPAAGDAEPFDAETDFDEPLSADEPFDDPRGGAEPSATPVDHPGEETAEYDVEARLEEEDRDQHADDMLEETPDFLQDTPDHDRLWFEQKPPRDFDFDG